MEELKKTFCRYDMVCDDPSGAGLEIYYLPEFFEQRHGMETDRMHMHGFYEIIWFQEGSGVHYVDFNEYPVEPGSIFFISPGQIHSFDGRLKEGNSGKHNEISAKERNAQSGKLLP